jgi:hypothetical protein
MADHDMAGDQALLQEHEELVQLYVHEDSMAWQLTLAVLAMNGAVFSGTYALGVFDRTKPPGFELYVLLALGVLLNIVAFFVLQRSKIHRVSRLFRAYQIEDALAPRTPIKAFTTAERAIHHKRMLRAPEEGGGERELHWYETVEILNFWSLSLLLALPSLSGSFGFVSVGLHINGIVGAPPIQFLLSAVGPNSSACWPGGAAFERLDEPHSIGTG